MKPTPLYVRMYDKNIGETEKDATRRRNKLKRLARKAHCSEAQFIRTLIDSHTILQDHNNKAS